MHIFSDYKHLELAIWHYTYCSGSDLVMSHYHKICQILCRSGTRTPASSSLGCWVGSWVTYMSSTTQCLQQNSSISWSMVQHGDTVVSTVALQARSWFKPAEWRGSCVQFACSPSAYMGSLLALCLPHTLKTCFLS